MDELARGLLLMSAVIGGPLLIVLFVAKAVGALRIVVNAPWHRGSEPFTKLDDLVNLVFHAGMAAFVVLVIAKLVDELG